MKAKQALKKSKANWDIKVEVDWHNLCTKSAEKLTGMVKDGELAVEIKLAGHQWVNVYRLKDQVEKEGYRVFLIRVEGEDEDKHFLEISIDHLDNT